MKSHSPAFTARLTGILPSLPCCRCLAFLGLLVLLTAGSTGCARVRQYSIDTWQGPLPMADVHYVEFGGHTIPEDNAASPGGNGPSQ